MNKETLIIVQKVKASLVLLLVLGSIFLAVETISVIKSWNTLSNPAQTAAITVNGTGQISAVPDIASFSYSAMGDGKTAKAAQDKATTISNSALSYLKGQGIADNDIQTSSYSISPTYTYEKDQGAIGCIGMGCPGKQVVSGYEAVQTVAVKVRDTAKAGDILSGIVSSGVTNLSGLSLTLDDPNAPALEARQKAIDDAKTQAGTLASQLGVRLVRITNFSENQGGGAVPMMYAKTLGAASDVASPSPVISTGENTYTSNVTISYEIQ